MWNWRSHGSLSMSNATFLDNPLLGVWWNVPPYSSFLQDSNILAWKFSPEGNCFQPAASLSGHQGAVVALVVGGMRLYSGSMDSTIRVSWLSFYWMQLSLSWTGSWTPFWHAYYNACGFSLSTVVAFFFLLAFLEQNMVLSQLPILVVISEWNNKVNNLIIDLLMRQ